MHLPAAPLRLPSVYRILTLPSTSSAALLFVSVSATCHPSHRLSVCLSVFVCLLLFLFVSGPVGRLVTGVAPVKPSAGIKRRRVRQALSHYAGGAGAPSSSSALLLLCRLLIESSDPKLMWKGAGAHLLVNGRGGSPKGGRPGGRPGGPSGDDNVGYARRGLTTSFTR